MLLPNLIKLIIMVIHIIPFMLPVNMCISHEDIVPVIT